MKRIFSIFFFSIALTVVSCQRVESDNSKTDIPNSEETQSEQPAINKADKTYTFSIVEGSDDVTKTIIGTNGVDKYAKWEDGDELGYLVNMDASKTSDVSVVGDNVTFSVTGALAVDDYLFAWYPNYEPLVAGDTEVNFNIPFVQVQDATTGYDMDAFPMVSNPIEVTTEMLEGYDSEADNEKPLADVRFANLASLINFRVFSSNATYQSEKVISVTFDAGTDIIAGTYAIDVYDIDFDDDATLALRSSQSDAPLEKGSSIITTSLSEEEVLTSHTDKASALDVYMTVIPGSYAGRVVVLTDKASYTFKISSAKEFARGAINTLGLDLNKVGTTAIRTTPYKFNLAAASYASASESQVTWESEIVNIISDRIGSNTKANNYLPTSQSSSRFYSGNKLTFSPQNDAKILKVKYTATTESYANAMANSTWTNADAIADSKIVTIIPKQIDNDFYATLGGTSGSTGIDVYYYGGTEWVLKSITVTTSPTKTSYVYGEIFDPTGMVVDANYEDAEDNTNTKKVSLSSGDYNITPVGALTMDVTEVVVSYSGQNAIVPITMSKATPALEVSPSGTINLQLGKTQQLTTTGTDGSLSYESNDPDVASVSSEGLITAVSAGDAIISISSAASTNYVASASPITVNVHVAAAPSFETIVISEDWLANLKNNTGNNAKFVDDGQGIWAIEASYGRTVQSATPAIFYSPIFDMSSVTKGAISFDHTGNLTSTSYATLGKAYYSLNSGEWVEISLEAPSSNWQWKTASIASSVYSGKTIQFKWESLGVSDKKWEICNFNISLQSSYTYTFTSKSWAATLGGSTSNWVSGKDGNALTSGRGVQVTTGVSGANATSPISFTNVSKIVVTYSTNASSGAGTIKAKVGSGTEKTFTASKTGGTTDRDATLSFSPSETGSVKLTVDCSTSSVYVKSITIVAD